MSPGVLIYFGTVVFFAAIMTWATKEAYQDGIVHGAFHQDSRYAREVIRAYETETGVDKT